MKRTWILDPGHGGISPGGLYLTKGKQSPQVPPGIYEGEFNRKVVDHLVYLCKTNNPRIDHVVTAPGALSPRESTRVKYANELHAKRGNCVYLAIHANAARGSGWSKAHGATVFVCKSRFTGKLSSTGSSIARRILNRIRWDTGLSTSRGIQGRRYYVLRATKCPAVLVECGFMTNLKDAKYMADGAGVWAIADSIFAAIREVEAE